MQGRGPFFLILPTTKQTSTSNQKNQANAESKEDDLIAFVALLFALLALIDFTHGAWISRKIRWAAPLVGLVGPHGSTKQAASFETGPPLPASVPAAAVWLFDPHTRDAQGGLSQSNLL